MHFRIIAVLGLLLSTHEAYAQNQQGSPLANIPASIELELNHQSPAVVLSSQNISDLGDLFLLAAASKCFLNFSESIRDLEKNLENNPSEQRKLEAQILDFVVMDINDHLSSRLTQVEIETVVKPALEASLRRNPLRLMGRFYVLPNNEGVILRGAAYLQRQNDGSTGPNSFKYEVLQTVSRANAAETVVVRGLQIPLAAVTGTECALVPRDNRQMHLREAMGTSVARNFPNHSLGQELIGNLVGQLNTSRPAVPPRQVNELPREGTVDEKIEESGGIRSGR